MKLLKQKEFSPSSGVCEPQDQDVRFGFSGGLTPLMADGCPPPCCGFTWAFLWAHASLVYLFLGVQSSSFYKDSSN